MYGRAERVVGDLAAELGVHVKKLPLRAGIFGAEPWTEQMRARIQAVLRRAAAQRHLCSPHLASQRAHYHTHSAQRAHHRDSD